MNSSYWLNFHFLCLMASISLIFAEVGLGLIGFGLSFTFLGVILYFDRGLLALGNVRISLLSLNISLPKGPTFENLICLCVQLFWLIGVGLLLGWQSTWRLFTNVNNLRVRIELMLISGNYFSWWTFIVTYQYGFFLFAGHCLFRPWTLSYICTMAHSRHYLGDIRCHCSIRVRAFVSYRISDIIVLLKLKYCIKEGWNMSNQCHTIIFAYRLIMIVLHSASCLNN